MMLQDEPLDYEALVEQYNRNLFLVLRGHRSAEYLDTWVPDENPNNGVLNMVEAAELAGTPSIAIRLGRRTLAALDLPALEAAAGRIGSASIEHDADGAILRVRDIAGTAPQPPAVTVSSPYQAAVAIAAAALKHGGRLAGQAERDDVFEATVDGVTLTIRVNSGVYIAEAAHSGAESIAQKAVLDTFCAELCGLTVQEAAEHGVIRLEFRMRADVRQRPVAGIVLPRNADAVFDLPARLVRAVAAVFRERTGKTFGDNTFTRRIAADWLHLDDEEKLAKINAAIAEHAEHLGLSSEDVRAVGVEQQVRVVLAFGQGVPVGAKPGFMRALEHRLRAELEGSLQLFMSEVRDENKTRRL